MKKFNSIGNYVFETIGSGRQIVYVVENDIDRNNKPIDEKWLDIFPEVEIDGRKFVTREILGEKESYSKPQNFNKGTKIGINVLKEIK